MTISIAYVIGEGKQRNTQKALSRGVGSQLLCHESAFSLASLIILLSTLHSFLPFPLLPHKRPNILRVSIPLAIPFPGFNNSRSLMHSLYGLGESSLRYEILGQGD